MPKQFGPIMRMPYFLTVSQHLQFQFSAGVTGLFETGSDHQDTLDPLLAALRHDIESKFLGHDDDRQIDLIGNIENSRIALDRMNDRLGRIDREDFPLEFVVDDVMQQFAAD